MIILTVLICGLIGPIISLLSQYLGPPIIDSLQLPANFEHHPVESTPYTSL